MSLNFGRSLLAIPGPSVIPERVLVAMHRPSPNVYEGEIEEISTTIVRDLKAVTRTTGNVAIYIANGHGAWEAALRNTLNPGDKVLVLGTGRFAPYWGTIAGTLGIDVHLVDFGMQSDADPNRLEEELRADASGKIKAVLTVQTDTASSVRNDIPALRKAIDSTGHDALFMVDCIASLACDRFEMDQWGVDVVVAGCQKGLMTPTGLSFVYFNDKAGKSRELTSPGYYWDWHARVHPDVFYRQFGGTPPTHHLFGLREALNMLLHEEGLDACWARHATIARAYWAAIDAWGKGTSISHNITDRSKRSNAVSTVATALGEAAAVRDWTEKSAGVTLGLSLGFGDFGSPQANSRFRIGHMGHQNVPMAMGVLGSIDAAFKALGIEHGSGALEAATAVIAQHGKREGSPT
jgi:alanine-glyoxylate transaminase/serine-glyoxylate transaminase/serine-pyruvate transaminase